MRRSTSDGLEERVARLERMVSEIHAHLQLSTDAPSPPPPPRAEDARAEAWAHRSEQWLGRVGLGLLFLGLVYLFNYSIQQGWITPAVRVGIGFAIATLMLALGLRLQARRRSYSQLLLAGALAVYYATGFAANQLYSLVGHGVAFVYMAGVLTLALVLAGRQDNPSLASLGALGGFATPLLLHRENAAVMELSVYGALVVGWAGVLYWRRGWPSLLWTYAAGGLAALSIAAGHARGDERWAVQAALLLVWLAAAALPFARGIARADGRSRRFWGAVPPSVQLRVLGAGVNSAVLLLAARMWNLGDHRTGALFLLAAGLFAGLAWVGTRTPNRVARAAAPVAAALCATGTYLVLDAGWARVVLLGAEALLFVAAGSRRRLAGVEWAGHALFAGLAGTMLWESAEPARATLDPIARAQLLLLLLLLCASAWRSAPRTGLVAAPRQTPWAYRVSAHALFLLWLAKELGPQASGTGLVTLAWGTYGVILLLVALHFRARPFSVGLQLVAFSALALTVLKLVLVDLGRLAMVWRILLFMGFGTAFLALSSRFKPVGK